MPTRRTHIRSRCACVRNIPGRARTSSRPAVHEAWCGSAATQDKPSQLNDSPPRLMHAERGYGRSDTHLIGQLISASDWDGRASVVWARAPGVGGSPGVFSSRLWRLPNPRSISERAYLPLGTRTPRRRRQGRTDTDNPPGGAQPRTERTERTSVDQAGVLHDTPQLGLRPPGRTSDR